ncbi:MAG: acriflavine resistance protein B [Dyadobacter sp. 50-39]|uniref:CusA/CzcA family heavy metal efflux RND transporter n=1 Tax=Dyadobacter sp. 50-39 TaxID=1895756 RepID=UPI00095AAAF0|nr:CusA/CzcA family heavy metal efflux RND transporter [Dyadobacter sp. 50-39]OJV19134.1 MAG: acriflavine resistance protein B [Dyadobacter sp. 50-39]
MLDRIIHFSIYNKLIVGIFTLALIAWGSYSLTRLPIDAVPDITDNQVMVITVSPTLAAQEVERLITFPVEQTMASIPKISQIRSFSRFGLSIVTIVFEESADIYWARQQISERLADAAKQIPVGVGTPAMAPVTTGLGEIYQYVIHPEKGYEDKYNAMQLREIQDWVVKRQLLGTPGVAEVSGFGGYVKEYEIAVNPEKLQSMGVTVSDIFTALEKNNQNTGGAYINKNPTAYFIRSEGLVKNLADLGKIVVKNNGNVPIYIRDVATARFGNSVRYGAATRNAQGETVTGIVMMLKGANSSEVIDNVKARIEQIKTTLPEGVTIEPFLDRQKLVDGAIHTVSKNLIEGALIVIFILILFLGNLRAGLVVASVIPLAMLFAISMMNIFGVSGNLMSLGAIDFGLIVDGAVIIVEATLHHIVGKRYDHRLSQQQMDEEVYQATVNIRSSAAFGEIIILMVYLPLWALVGIEGKMFKPMAQTVSFAILGAFILSLTYVPMMAALGLSKQSSHKPNISDKMMGFFHRIYIPVIKTAMRAKALVVLVAVALFAVSLFIFSRLGGEFIPQLDEGDFAVETRVLTGSSIDQMLAVSKKAQRIIMKFPEVKQVVNKIGSGEIPTDPMPIEAGDMMIILKDKSEWKTASSREELAEKMQEALSVIPNATFGFQQPIQMRFNELITGAKQDVVLKIYGEDLDVLAQLGGRVGSLIRNVDGVEDLYVEEVTGQPQIQVDFDRDKIAMYGLNIEDVNQVIRTGFAGQEAGLVFEGERRFSMVVRLDTLSRRDINDVRNLYVGTPSGRQIPLQEVANIDYKEGPNQIQRDDAKRRITLGFNVRSRDVQSIVSDIQQIIRAKMKLPVGYYVTYGGQFENLRAAKERLSIAVPVALFLILLLLYFTFDSVKQSLLIFSAIPLSAIGGIFALFFLGMPFSISAGVGFIALFGVAVLNGIVLIGEFNRLEKDGVEDIYERVIQGTQTRLRPVLMTAAVASLGFLPMALSQGSGAEVQRPLATVVIGGLVSATLLTLIVLPVLYLYFGSAKPKGPSTALVKVASLILVLLVALPSLGQAPTQTANSPQVLTLPQAIEQALRNNGGQKIAALETDQQKALVKGSLNLPKTDFQFSQGNINSQERDNAFNVTQRLAFPSLYGSQKKLALARVESGQLRQAIRSNDLVRDVKLAYGKLVYFKARAVLLSEQDSIFSGLMKASALRYQAGETNQLESATSAAQAMEVKNQIQQNNADIGIATSELQTLLNTQQPVTAAEDGLVKKTLNLALADSSTLAKNPMLRYLGQQIALNQQQLTVERQKKLPDLLLGYTNQSFRGVNLASGAQEVFSLSDRFHVLHAGISIPLLPGGYKSSVNAARISGQIAAAQLEYEKINLSGELNALIQEFGKNRAALDYYEQTALPQAALITTQARQGFSSGETSYTQLLQSISVAIKIRTDYLDKLYLYNLTVHQIEALLGIQ